MDKANGFTFDPFGGFDNDQEEERYLKWAQTTGSVVGINAPNAWVSRAILAEWDAAKSKAQIGQMAELLKCAKEVLTGDGPFLSDKERVLLADIDFVLGRVNTDEGR